MATLDEIGKLIANSPTFKVLDSLPLAAITMPPGMAEMASTFERISKLVGPAFSLPERLSMVASPLSESIIKFHDTARAAAGSQKLFSDAINASVAGPNLTMHSAIQAAFKQNSTLNTALLSVQPSPGFFANRDYQPSSRPKQIHLPTPATGPDTLLPPEVAKSRDYFAKLVAELKTLPPSDIITVLDWQLSKQQGATRELFLNRLAHYLADGKDFSPTCWQVVRLWLDSIRGKAPQPTWYNKMGTDASKAPIEHPAGHFAPLLLNYTITQLHALLRELGLITSANQAAPAASPGAWVGVIHGLLTATPPRLRNNKAAIQRAFCEQFGAIVGERAVQVGPSKRGSESERFRDSTLALLRERTAAD